jgi:replicative DNA helicase
VPGVRQQDADPRRAVALAAALGAMSDVREAITVNALWDAARHYLALGLHPIPCAPKSKRPIVEWRPYQDQAPLADEVDTWWEKWPDANVALVQGRGKFVVDLDGGHEAERLLIDQGVYLPGAPRVKTAGGFHVYLSAPGPVPDRVALLSTRGKKPQVDIRGVGIVVAPPSIHPTGAAYVWHIPLAVPFPMAPQRLLELLSGPTTAAHSTNEAGWVGELLRGVGEGLRDASCTKLAGYFLGRGLDALTVEAILRESFARNCTPAFPAEDVKKCVQSIARRESFNGVDRTIVPVPLGAVLAELVRQVDAGRPRGVVATPFPALNEMLAGGFYPGELAYLGARPGVGKTALALEIARRAGQDGHGVLVASREMLNLALSRRIVAQHARLPATALRRADLTPGQVVTLQEAVTALGGLPVWLTDEAVSITEIAGLLADWSAAVPLGLLIVDYLQLVRAPKEIRERRLQVEAVSQALKTLAQQVQVPVLALSSLSRPVDGKDRRPTLASLRESGELEHDGDIVLLLHREPQAADTECIIAKARDGETSVVHLTFHAKFTAFDEAPV